MLPSFDVGSRKVRRQHGFQLPLHPFQLSAWLILSSLTISTFLILIPPLPFNVQPTVIICFTCVLLAHIAAHLSVTLIDPAEAELRKIIPKSVPNLDRTKHAHVIENGFCNLCEIVTTNRTKHCSICNKCVAGFDHHCKWLNHCIGSRNYTAFLMCVSTSIVAAIFVAVLAVLQIFIYKFELTSFTNNVNSTEIKSNIPSSSLPSSDATFLAIVGIIAILALIAIGLLLHLCFFHIYISFLGLTTYEYIRQQRQQQEQPPVTITQDNTQCGNSNFPQRPIDLHCENRTFFSCTMVRETFTCCVEPTPTPPCTPQECQICVISGANNTIVPEDVKMKKSHKMRWNCCANVPDSPEEQQISPSETKCLLSLCRHVRKRTISPVKLGEHHHPRRNHWSSAKIRVLFKVLSNLGSNRKTKLSKSNQIAPIYGDELENSEIQTVNNLIPIPIYPNVSCRANTLPPLQRRRIIDGTELTNALSILQQQQQQQRRLNCLTGTNQYRRRNKRNGTVHRTKTPALSPIRESGLSNPASPSHCAINPINGACINRPN